MRMSEKKQREVGAAIAITVMDLRVEMARQVVNRTPLTYVEIDNELFKLETKIWKRVEQALNIEGIEQ